MPTEQPYPDQKGVPYTDHKEIKVNTPEQMKEASKRIANMDNTESIALLDVMLSRHKEGDWEKVAKSVEELRKKSGGWTTAGSMKASSENLRKNIEALDFTNKGNHDDLKRVICFCKGLYARAVWLDMNKSEEFELSIDANQKKTTVAYISYMKPLHREPIYREPYEAVIGLENKLLEVVKQEKQRAATKTEEKSVQPEQPTKPKAPIGNTASVMQAINLDPELRAKTEAVLEHLEALKTKLIIYRGSERERVRAEWADTTREYLISKIKAIKSERPQLTDLNDRVEDMINYLLRMHGNLEGKSWFKKMNPGSFRGALQDTIEKLMEVLVPSDSTPSPAHLAWQNSQAETKFNSAVVDVSPKAPSAKQTIDSDLSAKIRSVCNTLEILTEDLGKYVENPKHKKEANRALTLQLEVIDAIEDIKSSKDPDILTFKVMTFEADFLSGKSGTAAYLNRGNISRMEKDFSAILKTAQTGLAEVLVPNKAELRASSPTSEADAESRPVVAPRLNKN